MNKVQLLRALVATCFAIAMTVVAGNEYGGPVTSFISSAVICTMAGLFIGQANNRDRLFFAVYMVALAMFLLFVFAALGWK